VVSFDLIWLLPDEATSALDATHRILVFEGIKRWRQNKTTIVITHDLSQITPGDFVYVLRDGRVVEQGYRVDLEQTEGSELHRMMETQNTTGGFPKKENDLFSDEAQRVCGVKVEQTLEQLDRQREEEQEMLTTESIALKHRSVARPSLRPLTFGSWMFEAVADWRVLMQLGFRQL